MVDVAQNNPIVRTLVTLIVVCAAREGIRTNECKHKQHLICSDKTSHLSQKKRWRLCVLHTVVCCLCSLCLRPIVCLFVLLCLIYPSVSNLLFATRHFSPPLLFVQLFTVSPTWGTEALHYNTILLSIGQSKILNQIVKALHYNTNRSEQNTEPIRTGATIQCNRSSKILN